MPPAGSASPIALSIASALRSGSRQARVAPGRSLLTRSGTCSRLNGRFLRRLVPGATAHLAAAWTLDPSDGQA
jgi:hypothetical protein